ncbi:unnamed protein product [Coregonus sp. 'balchen']|nr:unnamed protein product [Coregonus sp. 'balchen']
MMEELVIKGGRVSPLPASPKKRGKRRGRSSDRKREMGSGGEGGAKRVMGEKGAVGEESPVSSLPPPQRTGGEGSGSPALFPTCFEIGVLEDGGEPRMQGTQEPNTIPKTIPASWVGELEGSGGASGGWEVHLRDSGDVIRFKREWDKGESVWGIGGGALIGVGILFGNREVKVEGTLVGMQGRVLGVDVTVRDDRYRVIVVYGPQLAAGRREIVDCLAPLCATNRHLVIGGDFNIDIGRGRDSSAGAIAGLMACHGLVDGGPAHCSDDGMSNMAQLQRSRAEARLYFSIQLSGRLLPVFFSDHDGVLLQVGAPVCLFGRGYWKLEREVLDEQAFVNGFVDFFRGLEGLGSMCEGVLEWWEIAKRKKREERLLELELEAGNLGGEVHERKARAFLEHAHSGFLEHDETCSAVFFKSVRGRQSRKVMYGVREENGRVVRETEEMVKVTTEHFQGFFQERAVDVEQGNVFLEHLSRRVPEDIREAMEAQISLEEVESALRRMGKGKVPGMDGLPAEFYLKFWGKLKFFGRWRGRTDVPGGLSLWIGALKILGVLFETSGSATLNWNRSIAVVQRKLGMWRARSLSFIGKVLVLKVDVLPSLLYMAYVYPLPASLRRPLVRLVFQFMWGGRLERVARFRMLCPIGEGGRGVRSVMVWTNTGPRAEQLPWHFGYTAKWLRGHPEVEVARVGLDHRHLYEEVRWGGCPGPVLGIPAVVWEGVQVQGLDYRLKDLNWLSLHKGLPVRSILYGRGMTRSTTCPRPTCGGEETLRHVFWGCAFAGVVWARVQVLIGRVRGDFVVTWARVERGVGKARGTVRDRFLLWLLISLFKQGLWEARQKMERTGREGGVEGIVSRI